MRELSPYPQPAFDSAAHRYDVEFTTTEVGRLQRKLVYRYLEEVVLKGKKLKVLELNCGTGADAIWMAQNGHQVLATDLSGEMVVQGQQKWAKIQENAQQRTNVPSMDREGKTQHGSLEFKQMDLRSAMQLTDQFDLVFSNFGGLNCISPDEFSIFLERLPKMIKPNGYFVGVIMPTFCAWETFYFLLKFRFRAAFRRLGKGPLSAPLGDGAFQDTWYYSPRKVRNHLLARNTKTEVRPIGFFLPPSYLDPFFRKRHKWLKRLTAWEYRVSKRSSFASRSDHFLISVQFLTNFPS